MHSSVATVDNEISRAVVILFFPRPCIVFSSVFLQSKTYLSKNVTTFQPRNQKISKIKRLSNVFVAKDLATQYCIITTNPSVSVVAICTCPTLVKN